MSDNFDFNDFENTEETENYINDGVVEDHSEDTKIKEENTETEDKNLKKGSFEAITGKKENEAPTLNRTLIIAISVCVFLFVVLFTLLKSNKSKKQMETEDEIGKAHQVYVPDFNKLAEDSYISAAENETIPDVETNKAFEDEPLSFADIDKKISDANINQQGVAPVYQNQNENYQNTGGYKKPDTRANAMQKNISGIKGLTVQQGQNTVATENNFKDNPYGYLENVKQTLTNNLLSQQGLSGIYLNQSQVQNKSEKDFFEKEVQGNNQGQFLPSLSLWEGTLIPAVLLTGIDTSLPGNVVARVSKNVYSSLDGKFLLIPQGTLLIAEYNSSVGYDQKRVQIGWTAMIRPDGFLVQLSNMPAVDEQGYIGVGGRINPHLWAFIKGLFLVSAISVLDTDINKTAKSFVDPYTKGLVDRLQGPYQSIQDKVIDKALNIEPSIYVKPGKELNVLVNKTLYLPPVPVPRVTQKYIRRK